MLAKQWLSNARTVMNRIEETQMENIQLAAKTMADSIECGRWVHTFGCGHATIPVEEVYPRIGGFVGFHPIIELPLTFFTRITGEMGVHQFVFLERVEGYGVEIMKGYNFDTRDTMWLFSHSGINNVNIDVALEAKKKGMKVVVFGSAAEAKGKQTRHSSGKTIFDIGDIIVDTCAPIGDASVDLKNIVMMKVKKPTVPRITSKPTRSFKSPINSGIPREPSPKNIPSRLRLAPFSVLLMSETTALVAPFIAPPPRPNKKMHSLSNGSVAAKAIPSIPRQNKSPDSESTIL